MYAPIYIRWSDVRCQMSDRIITISAASSLAVLPLFIVSYSANPAGVRIPFRPTPGGLSVFSILSLLLLVCVLWSDPSRVFLWTSRAQHRQVVTQASVAGLDVLFLLEVQRKNKPLPPFTLSLSRARRIDNVGRPATQDA